MNIQENFWSAITRGTGEAHLLIKKHPKTDFSEYILKAAIKNFDNDPQSNGSRATYITELIYLSPQKDKLIQEVLKALAKKTSDTWALVQLFDIAAIFAKNGNEQAKEAIYKRYPIKKIPFADWCGESVILDLDGIEGFKFIAETVGKRMMKNPDLWEDESLLINFQKENPSAKVYSELKKAAKSNIYIKKYLDAIRDNRQLRKEHKTEKKQSAFETINEIIETGKYRRIPPHLTHELKKKEINTLAKKILKEKDETKRIKYLSIFERTKFPFDYLPILEIAKKKNNMNNRLVEFANTALSFFTAKDIREFAISKLEKTKEPYLYNGLLVNNYKSGDYKLLKKLAEHAKTAEQAHRLVWSYVEIYEKNKTKECLKPLESLYDRLNCGSHRYDIVKILIDNKVLPKKIQEEIRYDSYKDTRNLIM